ncbi:shikimate dehydrogenase [Dysgonomonas sp. Marseille-P4677]|uniref:shikimate dehydrogenase family protein n=1 Tax=Dysgonomonas sp. Marseille-P4677 TaxID=2364790 RepID=UPI0019148A82|nr:shikimate dehydrogenase [Dysgonomonas sp. Marseille-P4677]MBK5719464.1 shikimate dehydrogenase [Dysgonomonas sp. Marseille-P4677]
MDLYGIIGNPLTHSFSPRFFTDKFLKEEIDAQYVKFEISDISRFADVIKDNPILNGLNVTIPYKEAIISFLDDLDSQAKEIGAINVIKFIRENGKLRLIGYNSDIIGFQNSIAPLLNRDIHKKALVLGTGGASKAVAKALENLGVAFTFVSRTAKPGQLVYKNLCEDIIRENSVIINTSPLGTFPNIDECADIPYQFLTPNHLLYDLVYNPAETKFLRLGKEQGATVKNGEEMLVLQALAAWEIWNK